MGRRQVLDWENIEKDYVRGYIQKFPNGTQKLIYPTYEDLAEKYECYWNTIATKGAKEKWLNKREFYQQRLKTPLTAESANLNDSIKYDMQNLIRIERIGELVDEWIESKSIEDEEGNRPNIEPKEINCVLDALTKSHSLAKKIFGEEEAKTPSYKTSNNVQANKKDMDIDAPTLDSLAQIIQSRQEKLKSLNLEKN